MRSFLWVLLGCVFMACGYILGHRSDRSQVVVARVDGQAITERHLELQLRSFRQQAMDQLIELRLLDAEARRQHLRLFKQDGPALIKSIILNEEGQAGLHKVYEICKPELTRYDCWVMLFADQESESAALEKLRHGAKFDQIARSYSQDQSSRTKGGHIDWVTLPQLKTRYGPYLAEQAACTPLRKVSNSVAAPYGSMVVMVEGVQDSFDDLRADCEEVMVEARTTALLARLTSQAVIER